MKIRPLGLERLSVAGNQLAGVVPESILRRWDAHAFEMNVAGTRFAKPTGRETVCVVREGTVFAMDRFSRALALVKFDGLAPDYDYPFTASTHQQYVTTTVTWGDERRTTVKTYGRQGPIEAWAAQQLFLGLAADTSWEREFRRPRCSFER